MHRQFGFADAAGNGLAEPITEAVLAHVNHCGVAIAFAALAAPVAVVGDPEVEVIAQQRPMAGGDHRDLRQPFHALEGLQHAAGVGAHQAVVVIPKVRCDRARVGIEDLITAVVQAEGIAGVEHPGAVIKAEDRVGPVQVGGTEELKAVLNAALGVGAEIQGVAAFHRPAVEGPVHLALQIVDGHLGAHHLNLWIEFQQIANQAGVIRFGVGNDQHIDRFGVHHLLQRRDPAAAEFGVARIDQCGALTAHQKRVVGGAIAQAELDIKAAAVPIEGAQGLGIGCNLLLLQRQPGLDGHHCRFMAPGNKT